MNSNEKRLSFIIKFLYFFIIILLVYLFIKYLLGPLSPFIAAFIIVISSRKLITKLETASRSKKYASFIFTVSLIALISLIVYGIFFGLFKELSRLSDKVSENPFPDLSGIISQKLVSLKKRFPSIGIFSKLFDFASSGIDDIDGQLIKYLSGTVPSLLSFSMRFLSFFPAAVIFTGFMFIAVFYISNDYEKICSFILLQLPSSMLDTFEETKTVITSTAKELFKSYFLLTFITFLQLLTGFMIMRIEYSLLLASLICFIDLLPILGTGTVLIPWAAFYFFTNNISKAACLIVLYVLITVFRRIAEPKIIGSNIGLHPLLSLISIFLGIKFMGFAGIIIFPILTITIIRLNRKGFIRLYKNFPENSSDRISRTRKKFLDFKRSDRFHSNSYRGDSHDKNNKQN